MVTRDARPNITVNHAALDAATVSGRDGTAPISRIWSASQLAKLSWDGSVPAGTAITPRWRQKKLGLRTIHLIGTLKKFSQRSLEEQCLVRRNFRYPGAVMFAILTLIFRGRRCGAPRALSQGCKRSPIVMDGKLTWCWLIGRVSCF
ncbi:hypothetical protein MVEN_00807400 [Mycena venus]|uniref:Uncharacterized protein n=1 Tax=Mycena venus TaxID=2733690 RepID=A0A8H6YM07_9AGAR|nr:hypothetical protein MVEN_00807400 [Mycena venus]